MKTSRCLAKKRPGSISSMAIGVVSEILGDGLIVFWNAPDTVTGSRYDGPPGEGGELVALPWAFWWLR